jgi:hypothetical protein
MSDIVQTTGVTDRDLARGRNLRIAGISAPIILTVVPFALFLILTAIFSGTPTIVISTLFFGAVATVLGLLIGLGLSAFFFVRHQRWSAEMRERIAIGGIGASEIEWFRKELKPSEKRALKAMKTADPLILDAYRETLASRLTATRIVRSSRRELQAAKRREFKLKSLKAENTKTFLEQVKADTAKLNSIHEEAKHMLSEAESRLEMIEAAGTRGGSLADTEVALKKLAARASQLPLALEAARIQEEAVMELETSDRLAEKIKEAELRELPKTKTPPV